MEEQDQQVQSEDVEAHIHKLQDDDEPSGEFDKLGRRNEQGKRS